MWLNVECIQYRFHYKCNRSNIYYKFFFNIVWSSCRRISILTREGSRMYVFKSPFAINGNITSGCVPFIAMPIRDKTLGWLNSRMNTASSKKAPISFIVWRVPGRKHRTYAEVIVLITRSVKHCRNYVVYWCRRLDKAKYYVQYSFIKTNINTAYCYTPRYH